MPSGSWALMRSRRFMLAVCGAVVIVAALGALAWPAGSLAGATCTDDWTGGGSGSWSVAENWSAGVPGSSDVVCIGSGATVHVSESETTGSIQGEGAVLLSGGKLELQSTSNTSEIAGLSLTGGTLAIAGELKVGGSLSSSSNATISGSGRLVIESGATGTVDSSACSLLTLSGVTFVNEGTLTLGVSGGQAGQLDMEGGAQLQNAGTFNADSYAEGCVPGSNAAAIQNNYDGSTPAVSNTGTFNVNVSSSNTAAVSVPFSNPGTVTVQTGTMQMAGGGSEEGGEWSTDSGTNLKWSGGTFSLTGDTWSGSGTIHVAGATVTATHLDASGTALAVGSGSLTIPSGSTTSISTLSLTGGTLAVAGEVKVASALSSSGNATVSGSGHLVVESGATGTVDSAACSLLTLGGVTFVNEGTVTLGVSGGQAGQLDMQEGAQLENAGTFNADSYAEGCVPGSNAAAIQNNYDGSTPAMSNTGTFNVNVGSSNTAAVSVPFSNGGTVHVASGTLTPVGGSGSTSSGTWTTASGTAVGFTTGSSYTLTEAAASGAKFSLTGGTLNIASGSSTLGTLTQTNSSTLDVSGELDISGSYSSSGSPTIDGSGRLVLSSGATGTVDSSACSLLTLSGVTFVNEGTVTLGASGGQAGQLDMEGGAQLQNAGTFNADSYAEGCVPGYNAAAIQNNGYGSTPAMSNTGTFNVNVGSSNTTAVSVPFSNQGTVTVQTGTMQMAGGGSEEGGEWSTDSGAILKWSGGTFSLTGDTWSGSGTIHVAGATVTATHLDASGTALAVGSGSLTIPSGSTTSISTLSLTGGTLAVAGEVKVASSFSSTSDATVSGSGRLVIESGATGTVDSSACSLLTLSGVTFVNEGTLTLGVSGGQAGQLDMEGGAQLQNAGTFNADSYANGCVSGGNAAAIQNNGYGSTPAMSNTGTFNVNVGSSNTAAVSVPFSNAGTVHVASGTLTPVGGSGSTSGGTWTTASGTAVGFTTGSSYTLTAADASGAKFSLTGGTLSIASGSSTLGTLTQTNSSTLDVSGELDISGSYSSSGSPTVDGSGRLVLSSGATGTVDSSACSLLTLSGVTFVNEGTVTLGASGGQSGQLDMEGGAQLQNAGTFNADSYANYCVPGGNAAAIQNNGYGSTPAVSNTGTFNVDDGGNTAAVSAPFSNQGFVLVASGTAQFSDGGVSGEPSHGDWLAVGGPIVLTGGTFIVVDGSILEARVTAATVVWVRASLTGSLSTLHPYVSGTVAVGGKGEKAYDGTFTHAKIEVAHGGGGTWETLCGTLTPESSGAFGCSWETAGGGYSDGTYELRAKLEGEAASPETVTTPTMTVVVDNTSPTGSVTAPPTHGVGGVATITGTASDSGSGVASWQLQIAHESSSEWADACAAQTNALSGSEYGCTVTTSSHENGAYELRAVTTDRAGNTHTTSAVPLHIDNATPGGSLVAPRAFDAGTVELEGTGTSSGGSVASWAVQITPAGSYSWSNACPEQDTSVSGSTYHCDMDTTTFTDGIYQLRALVTDTEGDVYATTPTTVTIDNTPPVGSLYAPPDHVTGTFEVQGYAADAGSGVESWTLQMAPSGSETWSEACTTQSMPIYGAVYGCEIDASALEDGTYQLRAVIVDNAGNSYTTPVVSFTVENTAPSNTATPAVSGYAIEGRTLSASAGSWTGASPITYAFQWERCNTSGESCSNIEEATSSTYALASGDIGHTMRIHVSATNAAGSTSASSTATAVVVANTLGDLSLPAVSGTPDVGSTVNADPGSWSGAPPISYAYQWEHCNSSGGECADISGAMSAGYVPVSGDLGGTLKVVVTATNGEGSASATSSATAVIAAGSGSSIRYLYDQAGRLSIVDDPTQGAAVYHWDADGNLTGIERVSDTTLSVLAFSPERGPVGTPVDITGTGFDPEASHDEVTFNGVEATVEEATATDLVVTVPEGASTGHITVTVSGHSATSTGEFTVEEGSFGMEIRRFSPLARSATFRATSPNATPAGTVSTNATPAKPVSAKGSVASAKTNLASKPNSNSAPAKAVRSRSRSLPAAPTVSAIAGIPAAVANFRPAQPAAWDPTPANRRDGDWLSGRPASPWATLPGLSAPRSKTALSGQVLLANGAPLVNVTLTLQGSTASVRTDRTGRFLLRGVPAGHQVLLIDGVSADRRREHYGQFSAGVELVKGKTTPLSYTIWMTPLDPAGNKTIPAVIRHETVLSNPQIPGLEVRLPAGTTVRTATGGVVRHLNMTAIPLDRTPFPLPLFVTGIPTYFTVQPGGAYLNKGARIVYPNWGHLPPGQRVDFWNYDPSDKGWYVYGKGSVSANGKQVIPDPGVRIWEFTGAMISSSHEPPASGPLNGESTTAGDPVDLYTGLFVYQHTDLQVPDSLMPVALTRVYRPRDENSYEFGIGTQSPFDLHLWSNENYHKAYLVLPDGGKIKFVRTSAGSGYVEAEYEARETTGAWQGAILRWVTSSGSWVLRRRDGMKFGFGVFTPLQTIENRDGDRITLVREGSADGPVVEIRTPHNRGIDLTYDGYGRIVQASDSAGQTVHYEYDSSGRLVQVTDPEGHVTRYAYDDSLGDMTSVTDASGHVLIANHYKEGLVESQTIGGVGTYTFSYGYEDCGDGIYFDCENVPTRVITPTGLRRAYAFVGAPGASHDTLLTPGELKWEELNPEASPRLRRSFGRESYPGNITSIAEEGETYTESDEVRSDEHRSRRTTHLAYESDGNVKSIKQEAGGLSPLTTSIAYNELSEPTRVTDPLGRTTSYSYDTDGNLTGVTDPMGRHATFGYDSEGELTSATDPDGNTTSYGYENGNQVSSTDPLGHETKVTYDSVGRPTAIRDAEGGITELAYNRDNELTNEKDPLGETTSYGYDAEGNLTSVTDPRGHTQTATYNSLDELESWTDALDRTTTYAYNGEGQRTSMTDPKGQKTSYTYDPLDRLEAVSFGSVDGGSPSSSITYGYNEASDLTSAVDSRAGTYTMGYDAFGRLTSEEGPAGTVGYTYDADSEPTSMTIGGETAASYEYDPDGALTSIDSPHGDVGFDYDTDGRTAKTTLPNGDSENYSYDSASQLTGIDYKLPSGDQIGDLRYTRDALGRITTLSGSEARTNLPEAITETTYDAANELTSLGGHTLSYDADGNLTSDASSSYTYNDRNQLTGLTQGDNTWDYAYDPFGRRTSKTKNGTETSYLYQGENPLTETTGGSTTELLNGVGLDERYARTTTSGTSSYLTDQLGSTIALAGSSGAPSTEYTYGPFGETTSSGTTSSNPYQYTGRDNEENGLQYNRARYYNPATARFTSQDPTGMAGSGINLYQYAGGDPVDFTDPTGLCFILSCSTYNSIGNAYTGAVDTYTGGLTIAARSAMGLAQPNFSSSAYEGGAVVGAVGAILTPGDEESAAADVVEGTADAAQEADRATSFIGFPDSPPAVVPEGAEGPIPTRGPGMQYLDGSGGHGLDPRVTGVRIMDETPQNPARVVYMNEQGQTVNPFTGQTISSSDPMAHIPW
jgi:RHS repeat-associated protein